MNSSFSGKATNLNLQCKDLPLRLTAEQIQNPNLIFEDFFECYQLNEVRSALWNWLVEVLSSERAYTLTRFEARNNIFFYEKMEALIEACFILEKRRRKKAKRRSKFIKYRKR